MMTRRNSDGPACRDCGTTTERVASFSLCPNGYCDRYAVPVNDVGQTDKEVEAIRDGKQAVSA